jgi:PIN domain nuclease of toxin-antitoxin system
VSTVVHERIVVTLPIASCLGQLTTQVRTIPVTPAIATTAVSLPSSFPGDPANRLIYATAIENGWPLVTQSSPVSSQVSTKQRWALVATPQPG